MTLISAFCENASCGSVFFSNSAFHIGPGATVNMIGNKIGPCPLCGSLGNVPDGIYTAFEQRLTNPTQVAAIQKVMRIISEHTILKSSPQNLRSSLIKEVPALSKWLPNNFKELMQFITALMVVLQFLYNVYGDHKEEPKPLQTPPPIQVNVDMSQALSMLLSAQQNSPTNNHQLPQQEQQPKKIDTSLNQNKASEKPLTKQ